VSLDDASVVSQLRCGDPPTAVVIPFPRACLRHASGRPIEWPRRSPRSTAWDMAPCWHRQGWPVFPLPWGAKTPPPGGFTGKNGEDADEATVLAYSRPANIGIRCPEGVIGLDVDEHGVPNRVTGELVSGGATLAELEKALGPLPDTWIAQGRREGVAGIRWLRVPPGSVLVGQAGPGIDVIQRHHRYAAVWPSRHATGVEYQTLAPAGDVVAGPMCPPTELPELPPEWVAALTATQQKRAHPGSPWVTACLLTVG
jgi:hypothetical protein